MAPLSPPRKGFLPINNAARADSGESDIPLTLVNTASSTGARRQAQTINDMSGSSSNIEPSEKKSGLFHRKSKTDADAQAGVIGRRRAVKKLGEQGRNRTWGDDNGLNAMGRIYNRIVSFSPVTKYMVYVVPVALLLAIPLIVLPLTGNMDITVGNAKSTTDHPNPPSLFYLFLWIEVSWLTLWGGKIVAQLLPAVFMFFCGVVSTGTRKYATVIRNLEYPISLLLWALASWLLFKFKFPDASYTWVDVIVKILGSLWVSSCVLLGEKFIIQLISISYHQRSFAMRIKDSKRDIHLLGLMYEASRTLFPMYCDEFAEEDYVINDSIEAMLLGNKKKRRAFHNKSGSITPNLNAHRIVGEVGRFGDKITSAFGNIASEITGKEVFKPNSAHAIVVEALEKGSSSEALARRIWMSFVCEGNDSLYMDDVVEVLGPGHVEDAEECFNGLDADENGDISLDEMVRKVVEMGKERKAITNSMKDIGQALKVLDSILLFIVLMIVIIIFLSFFQSSFVATLSSAGTALISLSFAISTTCQEFLGSIIFLFVKHPYDVGDHVTISGESLIIEKISLLYTIFTDLKGMQVTQVPNIVLNNLWIDNLSRSKAMKEVVEVNISYDTSFEDVELLRLEMEKFVRHPDNSRDFQPDLVIGVGGVGDLDKLLLKIVIKHKSNWHNESVRATRRSKFMCALALALKKVPIFGPGAGPDPPVGSFNNPQYAVAVDDTYAAHARDQASREADAKRMVPHLAPDGGPARSGTEKDGVKHVTEAQAVQELTARPPLAGMESNFGYNRDDAENGRRSQQQTSPTFNDAASGSDSQQTRLRAEGIEQIRSDLVKRHSTRGRRRAGDTAPIAAQGEGEQPAFSVTQYDSDGNVIAGSNRQMSFDAEDPGSGGYGGGQHKYASLASQQPAVSPRVAEAARESSTLYQGTGGLPPAPPVVPTGGYVSPYAATVPGGEGASSGATQQQQQQGLAPTSTPMRHGARPRGASVSQAEAEAEQAARRGDGRGAKKQFTK
ncbi:unnamed protein product [Discula destructiva]